MFFWIILYLSILSSMIYFFVFFVTLYISSLTSGLFILLELYSEDIIRSSETSSSPSSFIILLEVKKKGDYSVFWGDADLSNFLVNLVLI